MLARWQFMIATLVGILVAAAAGYTMTLFSQNRAAQAELATRAQYLQQSVQAEVLYRELIKGLADLSIRNQDKALTDLLAGQGITVNAPPAVSTPSTDARKGARP